MFFTDQTIELAHCMQYRRGRIPLPVNYLKIGRRKLITVNNIWVSNEMEIVEKNLLFKMII